MRRLLPLFILLLLASFSIAQAQDTILSLDDFHIYNIWVRPTAAAPTDEATPEPPLPGTVTSAYMTIENVTDQNYQLVGIEAAFAEMSMLHQTTLDDAGVARMRMIGVLDIPAGETVQLAPAGYHAMIMNLTRDLYPGEAVALTLTIADSNGVTFSFPVGALVTDLPPEEAPILVANTFAVSGVNTMLIMLNLDNRGEEADTLVSVESIFGDVALLGIAPGTSEPFAPVQIPPSAEMPSGTFRLPVLLSPMPTIPEALALTLTFASGTIITVAVPFVGDAQ